ncbi:hypothetical protein FJZ48_00230 [Candidatus Uhrbacteria bacterium]|nr:hypothetical protein [Candidatus Uhrbacteria bacterium]
MNIKQILAAGTLLMAFAGTPVLASESAPSTRPATKQEIMRAKKEIAECRARVLETYLMADRIALQEFESAKKIALESYHAALKKAKETKTREDMKAARHALETARINAKQTWQTTHKKILDTWRSEREACKTKPVS